MAENITFKRGKFEIAEAGRQYGNKPHMREVSGLVSSNGIGIHKEKGEKYYTLTHINSGMSLMKAASQETAKEKVARLSGVADWKKSVKEIGVTRQMQDDVRAISKNEPLPEREPVKKKVTKQTAKPPAASTIARRVRDKQADELRRIETRAEHAPSKTTRQKDRYLIKANARKDQRPLAQERAIGYDGQKKERRVIQQELKPRHVAYTVDVRNTTKDKKIK